MILMYPLPFNHPSLLPSVGGWEGQGWSGRLGEEPDKAAKSPATIFIVGLLCLPGVFSK